jgi:radical SAM superfamily enzyme YgiQ (UPF0313 family)
MPGMVGSNWDAMLVIPPVENAGVALTSLAGAEHIGVGYLAAALRRAGHPTRILNSEITLYTDLANGRRHVDDFRRRIAECAREVIAARPPFLGFSVTGPSLAPALEIAGRVRREHPDVHICLGGHQATAAARAILDEEPLVDSIGLGDCDRTIVPFVKRVLAGDPGGAGFLLRGTSGWDLRGASSRFGGHVFDLDDLPFPARDDFERIHAITGLREVRMATSRGCTEHCTFCADASQHHFRRYRMRSPDNVLAEIIGLQREYGIDHLWLVDDNFAMRDPASLERVANLARKTLEQGLVYTARAYFRPDAVQDRGLLELLFGSGIVTGLIGVESGSPRRLKYLGKRYSLDDVRRAAQYMHSVGMGLQIGFIFFDPLTSIDDLRLDAAFLRELGELYVLFNFVQNMDAYPGTAYRVLLEKRGLSTATHPYRGGFRQYRYVDPRIGELAAALEKYYAPSLMAEDNALWRVKLFQIPKLLWLARRGMLASGGERQARVLRDEVQAHCNRLNEQAGRFLDDVIEHCAAGTLERLLPEGFEELVRCRSPVLERIQALGAEAGATIEAVGPLSLRSRISLAGGTAHA